jgi:hypothetical protein
VAGFIAGSSMPLEAAQRRGAWKGIALFLPLAAWLVASRRGRWDELLAATVVTVAIAVPVLLASAAIELWVSPRLFALL